jgi:hypothetical protein
VAWRTAASLTGAPTPERIAGPLPKEGASVLRLKYVGIAVTDINDAIKTYEQFFGMKQMTPVKQARWGFLNCMMGDGFDYQV